MEEKWSVNKFVLIVSKSIIKITYIECIIKRNMWNSLTNKGQYIKCNSYSVDFLEKVWIAFLFSCMCVLVIVLVIIEVLT